MKSNYEVALMIAKHPAVVRLEANRRSAQFHLPHLPLSSVARKNEKQVESIASNLRWINVPRVWDLGIRGEGIVIATADTGVQWDHPALINQYRGYNYTTGEADHNYNWWDAVHDADSTNYCGNDSKEPCDDNGHGTHTIGSAVGDDGGEHQVGAAPEAKWIGCRNMQRGTGSPSEYIECLQFLLAPTDSNGNNPQPSKRPHVIVNSYACPVSEGCEDVSVLRNAVDSVVSSGIFMSVASGNSGPACGSTNAPPATYESSFTVGSSESHSDSVARFSSRGPVPDTFIVKPDIIAQGDNVMSCFPIDNYLSLSGTSMAAPQIAGVVALVSQANSVLERNIEQLRSVLESSAREIPNSACDSPTDVPNNLYGYGMVDAYEAVQVALQIPEPSGSRSASATPFVSASPIPSFVPPSPPPRELTLPNSPLTYTSDSHEASSATTDRQSSSNNSNNTSHTCRLHLSLAGALLASLIALL